MTTRNCTDCDQTFSSGGDAVLVTSSGQWVLVADSIANTISVFAASNLAPITTWTTVTAPFSLAEASDGRILVSSGSNIHELDPSDGSIIRTHAIGQGYLSIGLAVSFDGKVYGATYNGASVRRWNADFSPDTSWGSGGQASTGGGSSAYAVAVHPSGKLLVTDNAGTRLLLFSPDGSFDKVLVSGYDMRGVAVDSAGYIYVIQFSAFNDGKLRKHLIDGTQVGEYNGVFRYASGVAIGADAVWVVDAFRAHKISCGIQ